MHSVGLLLVLGLGLLGVAGGLLLWLWAQRRTERAQARRQLDRQLDRQQHSQPAQWQAAPVAAEVVPDAVTAPVRHRFSAQQLQQLQRVLRLPGWLLGTVRPAHAVVVGVLLLGVSAVLVMNRGWGTALSVLAVALPLLTFWVWLRIQKARRRIVQQLPGFLDIMVRLISIGNSTHAAFQMAVVGTKPPLQDHLEYVVTRVRAGMDLDEAMGRIARRTRVEELHLTAAILALSVRYGGRADQLLERVAAFMRDREQAQDELTAMSAETRLSAWVLGLLPVVVGGAIIAINASYFTRMWADPSGQNMILGAVALQLTGAFLLYRLARLA